MTQRNQDSHDLQSLSVRPTLRVALLLVLAIVPAAVYAGEVTRLLPFVNGTVADADEVNVNFDAVASAVNDNDARITTLETPLGVSCPTDECVSGLTVDGSLICQASSGPVVPVVRSIPIPDPWSGFVVTPLCPLGLVVIASGIRPPPMSAAGNVCNITLTEFFPAGGQQIIEGGVAIAPITTFPPGRAIGCAAATLTVASNCECFAVCG